MAGGAGVSGDVVEAVRAPSPHVDRARWALLLCWVVLLGWSVGFSERPASLERLTGAVVDGQVHSVRVGPPALPADGGGYASQELHWRDGPVRYRTEVMMWTQDHTSARLEADGDAVRHGRDIAVQLRALDPGLRVSRVPLRLTYGQVYGWYVPSWVGLASFSLILATLGLLVSGPRPWWATRWAWFWLMATPVGVVAFLALSGPTPGVPAPRSPRPLLRGGWGLVLAAVMASFLPSWWHST